MRLAFRQGHHGQGAGGIEPGQRRPILHHRPGTEMIGLDLEGAEMLGEPRAPGHGNLVARLQDGTHRLRTRALDQAGMPALALGQDFYDRARLSMRPHGEHDALVTPFHDRSVPRVPSRVPTGPCR